MFRSWEQIDRAEAGEYIAVVTQYAAGSRRMDRLRGPGEVVFAAGIGAVIII